MSATLCLLTSNADAVLARRARELARSGMPDDLQPHTLTDDTTQMALFFRLGEEYFAVDVRHVLGAGHEAHVLPLPGTPSFILGVMLWEGRILAVNDLAQLLGRAGETSSETTEGDQSRHTRLVVALQGPDPDAPQLELLVEVDALLGVGGLRKDVLPGGERWRPPPPAPGRLGHCRCALVTQEMVLELPPPPAAISVLDMVTLLSDPELQPGGWS
ncbi:chemotaxis protein CheW [Megalodesulfovibrio paquesii]